MKSYSEKITPILNKIILVSLFTFAAFSMFSISIAQIAAGVGGTAWLFRTHITKDWHGQYWPLGIPITLFTLACIVAVIFAYDTSYSYKELKKLLEILIFFWVVNCVREKCLRDSLSTLLIISATLACLYGFYQGWNDGVGILHRTEGTMSVYMTFAGIIMLAGMHASGKLLFRRPVDPLLLPALLIISFCLLLTYTRQAWFGFLIGLFFLISIWRKKQTAIISSVIIVLILAYGSEIRSKLDDLTAKQKTVTLDSGKQIKIWQWGDSTSYENTSDMPVLIGHLKYRINRMLNPVEDNTFLMRKVLWKGGLEIFKDHPLTGCGFKCVDLIHTQYPDPTGHISRLRGMHNNFIQLAVDTGVLGLSAWLSIWVCFFRIMYKRAKTLASDQSSKWVIAGSSAAVIAFLAGGCFESNLYDSEVNMLLWFIMAMPFADPNTDKSIRLSEEV